MYIDTIKKRKFVCFIHTTQEISIGISINLFNPNIEIHLPFCFIKIGWKGISTKFTRLTFGLKPYYIKINERAGHTETDN